MLQDLDTQLFFLINAHHSPFWDTFFWWLSDKYIWLPFYVLIVLIIIKKYRQRALWYLLAIGGSVGAADFISSGIIKPIVKRLRPSHEPMLQSLVHTLHNYTGGEYGMASSHAANSFALATILYLLFRNSIQNLHLLFIWAALVAYSRIYLGVHYPTDVLVGLLVGITCGIVAFKIFINKLNYSKK